MAADFLSSEHDFLALMRSFASRFAVNESTTLVESRAAETLEKDRTKK